MTTRIAVVGATGYTGVELLRLLARHPAVEIGAVTSRSETGRPVSALFPSLRGVCDAVFEAPDVERLAEFDLAFFATPNGTAMSMARALVERGVRIIDLAADFRLRDAALWSRWYGQEHLCPELLEEAVYGLPEVNREAIRGARVVANPGCYPTAIQLGFVPLLERGLVDPSHLVADAKSGVSGAGRKASLGTAFGEVAENFRAYAVAGHRHHPEIVQGLRLAAGADVGLTFVPHLTPMVRGIHATLYGWLTDPGADVDGAFAARYAREPFVDLMGPGEHPDTRSVRGSNVCRIAWHRPAGEDVVVVLVVEDNLVKGAAGQAVQNMNLMIGCDETAGLLAPALSP